MIKRNFLVLLMAVLTVTGMVSFASARTVSFSGATKISLGEAVTILGPGAVANGNSVSIIEGGSYTITGALKQGVIAINTDEDVSIELDKVSIAYSQGPAIISTGKGNVDIYMKAWTSSYIKNSSYVEDYRAAIYVEGNLSLKGEGSLSVVGVLSMGIQCGGTLTVDGGTIGVNSYYDGLVAKGDIIVDGGYIRVVSEASGMLSGKDIKVLSGKVVSFGGVGKNAGGLMPAGDLLVEGGYVISTGNLLPSISDDSSQGVLVIESGNLMNGYDCFHITGGDNYCLTFEPSRPYRNIIYSSDRLEKGETYTVYVGGTSTGASDEGEYWGGSFSSSVNCVVLDQIEAI